MRTILQGCPGVLAVKGVERSSSLVGGIVVVIARAAFCPIRPGSTLQKDQLIAITIEVQLLVGLA